MGWGLEGGIREQSAQLRGAGTPAPLAAALPHISSHRVSLGYGGDGARAPEGCEVQTNRS